MKKLPMLLMLLTQASAETPDDYAPAEHFATKRINVEYGRIEYVKYPSSTTGTERKLKVLLPAGYDENREYPVLYLLHGIGGDQN